jgi:CRP-like cAMP-binding protein
MFRTLMEMPLFHGVSYQKLSEIIGKHRFHFLKYTDKERIISADDPCTHLSTIVSGSVRATIESTDQKVKVSQTLEAPEIISPEFFFGPSTRYPATITANGTCGIMQIEKKDYIEIIKSDTILLFNFLNILSMNAQRATNGVLAITSGDLRKRIAYWIVALTQRNGKDIKMECRQRDLYSVFGVPRQSLTAALAEMKAADLLDFTASGIEVYDRRKLVELLDD